MSVYTVARDDFKNTRRSYIVLGVIGVFTALVGLIFVFESSIYENAYRTLFDVSALIGFVFPLFLAPLAYLSIAGDRESGAIKYVMGLPNRRVEYFFGKLFSRLGVGLAAVALGVLAGFVVAFAAYETPPDLLRFLWFGITSLVFTFSFISLIVALSASTGKRSRAMLGVLGLYFVFVPFWFGFIPVININTLIETVASLLGITFSETTRGVITTLSPSVAYLQSTEIVYQGLSLNEYPRIAQQFAGDEFYQTFWFNFLVMVAWGVIGLVAGFASFKRSELG